METIQMKINDLNSLVARGKGFEAFDKYYHEEVIMQENESPPTIGKANNLKCEKTFFKEFEKFKMIGPLKVVVGENISMVE